MICGEGKTLNEMRQFLHRMVFMVIRVPPKQKPDTATAPELKKRDTDKKNVHLRSSPSTPSHSKLSRP